MRVRVGKRGHACARKAALPAASSTAPRRSLGEHGGCEQQRLVSDRCGAQVVGQVSPIPRGLSTMRPSSRSHRVCSDFAVRPVPSLTALSAHWFAPSVSSCRTPAPVSSCHRARARAGCELTRWRKWASSDSVQGLGFGLFGSLTTTRFFFPFRTLPPGCQRQLRSVLKQGTRKAGAGEAVPDRCR